MFLPVLTGPDPNQLQNNTANKSPPPLKVDFYRVYVQRVHREVVRVHVQVAENFLERHLLTTFVQNHAIGLRLVTGHDLRTKLFQGDEKFPSMHQDKDAVVKKDDPQ